MSTTIISPAEFVLALKAGLVEWRKSIPGVSIAGVFVVGQYVPVMAGAAITIGGSHAAR